MNCAQEVDRTTAARGWMSGSVKIKPPEGFYVVGITIDALVQMSLELVSNRT